MRAIVALLFVASCAGRAPVVDDPHESGEGEGEGAEGEGEGGGEGEGEGECTVDTDCALGLVCAESSCLGTCVPPAGVGAACDVHDDAGCGFSVGCVDGRYCQISVSQDQAGGGSCATFAIEGEPCGGFSTVLEATFVECAPGLTCDCGICSSSTTSRCAADERCGIICDNDTEREECVPAAPVGTGERCQLACGNAITLGDGVARECADGLACRAPCAGATECNNVEGCCCG